jgi:hypothetical protein
MALREDAAAANAARAKSRAAAAAADRARAAVATRARAASQRLAEVRSRRVNPHVVAAALVRADALVASAPAPAATVRIPPQQGERGAHEGAPRAHSPPVRGRSGEQLASGPALVSAAEAAASEVGLTCHRGRSEMA